jgi:SAM-dependent methyltransferase
MTDRSGPVTAGEPVVFDRVADRYDETRGGLARARNLAPVLVGMLPPTGPVLEVGVGTGLIATGLAELGRPVVGVDLSTAMLARAARRMPGRVAVADARQLPIASGAVAGAVLVHVLHVVGDLDQTLAELARVLRPGGVAVATAEAEAAGPESDVHAILTELERTLRRPPRPDQEGLVLASAQRHGLRLVERRSVERGYDSLAPREVAGLLTERSWSWSWPFDDELWAREAEPAIARLRALPDQDRTRVENSTVPLLALRRDRPG